MSTIILILITVISLVECQNNAHHSDGSLRIGDSCDLVQDEENGFNFDGLCVPIQNCPVVLPNLNSQNFNYTVCGHEGLSMIICCPTTSFNHHFVVGGIIVTPGEYTHMAALGYKLNQEVEWNCGGSLISDRYVLTAAHCLTHRSFGSVQKVRLGALNLLNNDITDESSEDFDVAKRIPHPDYNRTFVYNDIGLIELATQAHFNYYIRPICLPYSADLPQTYKSMGWGATGNAENPSVQLLKIDQELFSYEECQKQYNVGRKYPNGIMNDTLICAGSRNSNQSTCQGDSGGPLLIVHRNLLYIYGIVSFGSACGFVNSPGVYTKVFPYVRWIEETIFSNMTEKTLHHSSCQTNGFLAPAVLQ